MISSRSSSVVRRTGPKVAKAVLARGAHKEIKFSNEGRAAMLAGVDVLANAVSVTLGPKGELVLTEANCPCLPGLLTNPTQVEMSLLNSRMGLQRSQKACFPLHTRFFIYLTSFQTVLQSQSRSR